MRYIVWCAAFVSVWLEGGSAFAQQQKDAASTNLFALDYFAGTWQCEGNAFDFKTGKQIPVKGTWDFTYDCNHALLADHFVSDVGGAAFSARGWHQYREDTRTFQYDSTDSDGSWGSSTSLGWADDVIVWRGSLKTVDLGPYDVLRIVTRKAYTRFWTSLLVRPAGHQRWFDAYKGNCRRPPPWGR